jgi:hypothetical protein
MAVPTQDSFAQAVKVAIKAVEQDIPSLIAANMVAKVSQERFGLCVF